MVNKESRGPLCIVVHIGDVAEGSVVAGWGGRNRAFVLFTKPGVCLGLNLLQMAVN